MLLNNLIGVGIFIGSAIVLAMSLAIAGWTERDFETESSGPWDDLAFFALLVACIIGWNLFAYARGSSGRRWLLLGGVVGGTWLVTFGILLETRP